MTLQFLKGLTVELHSGGLQERSVNGSQIG
jgi:hypothetical protein